MKKVFGERLKILRKSKGLSLKKVSELIDRDYTEVLRYEKGQRYPRLDIFIKIAEIFDTSTDYLLGLSDFKKGHVKIGLTKTMSKMNDLSDNDYKMVDSFIEFLVSRGK